MHRSSETVGLIATALAKAQCEMINPEKSMTGVMPAQPNGRAEHSFRYASLASGLDIIRKSLGKHEIAVMQTTAPDLAAGTVILTTLLAHTSGEWISSEWPVCQAADITMPRRMGAALTYARRYSLFTLVGIAGDDDLDAPYLRDSVEPQSVGTTTGAPASLSHNSARQPATARSRYSSRQAIEPAPKLDVEQSATLRDRLMDEASRLDNKANALTWAVNVLPAKNTLLTADAVAIERAFQSRLAAIGLEVNESVASDIALSKEADTPSDAVETPVKQRRRKPSEAAKIDKSVLAFSEPRRARDKHHLKFVASKPCLVCGRSPADAHHLRHAQASAMSRKVSDEFTVPLCRTHHSELHRHGQEETWWGSIGIDPLTVAAGLWQETRSINASAAPAVKP